jgi:hypothetical protein
MTTRIDRGTFLTTEMEATKMTIKHSAGSGVPGGGPGAFPMTHRETGKLELEKLLESLDWLDRFVNDLSRQVEQILALVQDRATPQGQPMERTLVPRPDVSRRVRCVSAAPGSGRLAWVNDQAARDTRQTAEPG